MKKSNYEKALDILVNSLINPQDEICYELSYHEMRLIIDIIQEAKKQEKLLELYKELSNYVSEQYYAHEFPEINRLRILIEELENDKI